MSAALMLAVALAAQVPTPGSPPFRWWLAPAVMAEIHLTDGQSKAIDAVVESTLPERRVLRQKLDALQAELDKALAEATLDDADAAALIGRVEDARARRNVARSMMLFRIRRILTPDQRAWFDRRTSAAPH